MTTRVSPGVNAPEVWPPVVTVLNTHVTEVSGHDSVGPSCHGPVPVTRPK